MKEFDKNSFIIIGIGNNTRQDDGLGWKFVEKLEEASFNQKNLVLKYQLMVEDAELISNYNTVIFVDASKTKLENGFEFSECKPSEIINFSTHFVPPNQILNLCQKVYNKTPKSYIMAIEGFDWDIKIGLSKKASTNLDKALTYFKKEFDLNT